MAVRDEKSPVCFGFLTVMEHPQHGLLGGYLVLNAQARPLEFHLTAPVKPTRAQEILYGPTLEPYLYGEQIGQALVRKSAVEPLIVWTDTAAALALREYVATPVALVVASGEPSGGAQLRVDGPHAPACHLVSFRLGRHQVAVPSLRSADQQAVVDRLAALGDQFDADWFDLAEPFGRIRGALEEAQRKS